MALGVLFALGIVGAGFGVLRLAGLARGAVGVGLAPVAGLSAVAIVSTCSAAVRAAPPVAGLLCLGLVLIGIGLTLVERAAVAEAVRRMRCDLRAPALLLGAAVVVPVIVMGVAFQGIEAPLSTHDGAFHVEVIDSLRHGGGLQGWYPPGLEASVASVLELLPWVDSAAGSFGLALGLSLLAPVVVFGLGVAVWHDAEVAGLAALFSSLTYLFGYFAHIWSGWPLEMGTLLALGLWTLALDYLDQGGWRRGVMAGLILGAIVLTHGSELITVAILLSVLLVAGWRKIDWRSASGAIGLAVVVGLVCAGPYLPGLFGWAAGGGATAVGYAEGGALDVAAQTAAGGEPLRVFALDAIGIDLPVRLVLAVIGGVAILRRRAGRSVLAIGLIFIGIALGFTFLIGAPLVRQVYALVYPWGLAYRLFMVVAVSVALTAAMGGVTARRALAARWSRMPNARLHARLLRAGRVGVVAWLVLSTWALVAFVSIPAAVVSSYSPDDAAAMGWLRTHAAAGAVLANDGFADAGIWAPYKAGLRILEYRSASDPATQAARQLVLDHIGDLDQNPEAMAAACALNVQYVYYGAQNTAWQARAFPPLEELRASPALEEMFSKGDTAVFRTLLACADA